MAEANLGGDFAASPRTIRIGNASIGGPAPSVGRIVHYVSYGTPGGEYPSVCRAAIVTEVTEHPHADGTAGLCVLNPTGQFFNQGVHHAEDKAAGADVHPPGTWHWPERA